MDVAVDGCDSERNGGMGSYPRAPSLALRAIHLVPPYMIQFVKWFNVYTIMITIYQRAG